MGPSQQWVSLGKVLREWGVRGHLKCEVFNPESSLLLAVKSLFLQTPEGYREFAVEQARPHDRYLRLKLKGIDQPETAKEFRGCLIGLPREALPPLAAGEFYLADLVGFSVEAPNGEKLGDVLRWEKIGDTEVFLVGEDMESAWRVPYRKIFIQETLPKERKIRLKPAAMELFES